MGTHWRRPYRPTVNENDCKSTFDAYVKDRQRLQAIAKHELRAASRYRESLTHLLKEKPYNPILLLDRSELHLRLRFPELALGDAYKACMLLHRHRHEFELHIKNITADLNDLSKNGQHWAERSSTYVSQFLAGLVKNDPRALHAGMECFAIVAFCEALFFSNCFAECLEIIASSKAYFAGYLELSARIERLRDAAKVALEEEDKFHRDNGLTVTQARQRSLTGSIYPQVYPWTSEAFIHRSTSTMRELDRTLQVRAEHTCTLKPSETLTGSSVDDGWGISSEISLPADYEVFFEHSVLTGISKEEGRCSGCRKVLTNTSRRLPCCDINYCSPECHGQARRLYHPSAEVCSTKRACQIPVKYIDENRFHWVNWLPQNKAEASLFRRIFTSCAFRHQKYGEHPLGCEAVRGLCSSYSTDHPMDFSFRRHIQIPFEVLQAAGIDIFAQSEFDTCNIITIINRLQTNTWQEIDFLDGGREVHWINVSPLYTMCNHSCNPNVEWRVEEGSSTAALWTLKPIEEGEELCVSYLPKDDLDLDWTGRQEKLQLWCSECRCNRCQSERILEGTDEDLAIPTIESASPLVFEDFVRPNKAKRARSPDSTEARETSISKRSRNDGSALPLRSKVLPHSLAATLSNSTIPLPKEYRATDTTPPLYRLPTPPISRSPAAGLLGLPSPTPTPRRQKSNHAHPDSRDTSTPSGEWQSDSVMTTTSARQTQSQSLTKQNKMNDVWLDEVDYHSDERICARPWCCKRKHHKYKWTEDPQSTGEVTLEE